MSLENSNDTIGNRTCDLPTCSAVNRIMRMYGMPEHYETLHFITQCICALCMISNKEHLLPYTTQQQQQIGFYKKTNKQKHKLKTHPWARAFRRPLGFLSFVCLTAGWKQASIRKVLRPAVSTQVFLVFLCLQANAEIVPNFPKLLLHASHAALSI